MPCITLKAPEKTVLSTGMTGYPANLLHPVADGITIAVQPHFHKLLHVA
jgi:hypothetical protein